MRHVAFWIGGIVPESGLVDMNRSTEAVTNPPTNGIMSATVKSPKPHLCTHTDVGSQNFSGWWWMHCVHKSQLCL